MCHNCGASTSFFNFLKQIDPNLVNEYTLEQYKESGKANTSVPDLVNVQSKPIFNKKLDLPTIESLPEDHFAKSYVINRKIPKSHFTHLYYAEDFKNFVDAFEIDKDLKPNDKRLVIPFYNKEGELTGFQGRALGESKLRYITIKLMDEVPRMFGMDRVDEEDVVYVFEGPIDSMFIKNSVAVASSSLESASEFLDKSKLVLVFDNEARNKEILKLMEHAIDNHYNVVIWPEMMYEKDINEMILSGFDTDEISDIMKKNTFVNLRAKMEFVNWKKI